MSGPVYNFYNCCCGDDCTGGGGGTPPGAPGAVFPIKSINGNLSTDWTDGDVKWVQPFYYATNLPNGATEVFNNIEAYPFAYRLTQLSLIKGQETGTTSETMNMGLIVMDYAGNVLRTISAQPIELVGLANEVWTPITFVADPAALVIQPGEVVVQHFVLSAHSTDNWQCHAYASGLAELA